MTEKKQEKSKMENQERTLFDDMDVIYSYSRDNAIEDGIIVDATEFLKVLNADPKSQFDKIYCTKTIFEDILNKLTFLKAVQMFADIIEQGRREEYHVEIISHFHLPKEKIKIKSSKEGDKFILEFCYVSED
jgi:hypothetical protein